MRLWRRKPKVSDGSTVTESLRKRGIRGGRVLPSAEAPWVRYHRKGDPK